MATTKTGWERDKRTHFDDIVLTYDRVRPEYPSELYEDILKYIGQSPGKTAVEIGAGTGKATAPFLDLGYSITAIEIGQNMADFLLRKFDEHKNFSVMVSSFEDAPLQENYYDLIYAASAFHWIDAKIGCPKAHSLLKKGGVIALFRYNAIAAVGDALYDEIQAIYEKYYYSYYPSSTRPTRKSKQDFEKPSEIYTSFRFEYLGVYGFKDILMKFYDATRTFNADEYILSLETMSDYIHLPDNIRTSLFSGIKETIIKHGNQHKVDYNYQLYMGRK
ncbi:MAG: class I SAM-dependent methyltransferase [Defluviitaleaceae bacterium]|nr:class I SAM-dependent methyltransferase [Defluviitaleaceae bacterium]